MGCYCLLQITHQSRSLFCPDAECIGGWALPEISRAGWYGDRIKTPSEADSKKAYDAYIADASQRDKEGKLKPGENVKNVNGKFQVSGQVAVMAVSANIARMVFDSNPDREFFIEESFPLDWMYPYLSPNGFIMKINRKPPGELAAEIVRKDRDHWMWFVDRAVGQWLTPETPLKDVCEFAAKVFGARESGDYQADDRFVRNGSACKTYSKLRSSIAQVYVWHWKNSKSPDDKKRMAKEADFAFRQAFALCPYSSGSGFPLCESVERTGTKDQCLVDRADSRATRSAQPPIQQAHPAVGRRVSRYSCFLASFTPATMFRSFCLAAQRAVWLNPQSGAKESRSAGACFRQGRARDPPHPPAFRCNNSSHR